MNQHDDNAELAISFADGQDDAINECLFVWGEDDVVEDPFITGQDDCRLGEDPEYPFVYGEDDSYFNALILAAPVPHADDVVLEECPEPRLPHWRVARCAIACAIDIALHRMSVLRARGISSGGYTLTGAHTKDIEDYGVALDDWNARIGDEGWTTADVVLRPCGLPKVPVRPRALRCVPAGVYHLTITEA